MVVADDANDDHDVTEEYAETASNYMEPVRSSGKVTFTTRISGAVPQPI